MIIIQLLIIIFACFVGYNQLLKSSNNKKKQNKARLAACIFLIAVLAFLISFKLGPIITVALGALLFIFNMIYSSKYKNNMMHKKSSRITLMLILIIVLFFAALFIGFASAPKGSIGY